VRKVLEDIQANYSILTDKIYSTGFSNGSMMTHRLACEMSDKLAAVAAVGGGSAQFDKTLTQYYVCAPSRPIPVLHIHTLNDRNVPFAGGFGVGLSGTNYYPIDSTIADWRTRNNVTDEEVIETLNPITNCYSYAKTADASKPSAPVVLCKVNPVDRYDAANDIVYGGGHSWPGGLRSPAKNSDIPTTEFDASAYIWHFFNP
jgi:polyhydroxybutyrate depolymerase